MKDGAMLDTFPSIPLLILPLILFLLYSTCQLRLLSVAYYYHTSQQCETDRDQQLTCIVRACSSSYISFIVEEYENWLKFVNNINKG